MEAKRCGSQGYVQNREWGVLWGWPMGNLIVHGGLEGGETQGGINMEERLLSIWVGQRRA